MLPFLRKLCVHHSNVHQVTVSFHSKPHRQSVLCLAVTCHLHFWQNDWDLVHAAAVTWGWTWYQNKSQHRRLTPEKKLLPPLLPGLEPGPFVSRVRRSNHWAIPAPLDMKITVQRADTREENPPFDPEPGAVPLSYSHSTFASQSTRCYTKSHVGWTKHRTHYIKREKWKRLNPKRVFLGNLPCSACIATQYIISTWSRFPVVCRWIWK